MKIRQLPSDDAPLNETIRHEFLQLEGAPWVEIRQATRANRGYFNASLRLQQRLMKLQQSGDITLELLESQEKNIRKNYVEHVVVGIGGWIDDNTGQEVPSTKEGIRAVIEALPEALFNELTGVASHEDRFRQ